MASATLIDKLIVELRRIRKTSKVELQLDKEILDIFFVELREEENMEGKLREFMKVVMEKFKGLGTWTEEHSMILNGFLQ